MEHAQTELKLNSIRSRVIIDGEKLRRSNWYINYSNKQKGSDRDRCYAKIYIFLLLLSRRRRTRRFNKTNSVYDDGANGDLNTEQLSYIAGGGTGNPSSSSSRRGFFSFGGRSRNRISSNNNSPFDVRAWNNYFPKQQQEESSSSSFHNKSIINQQYIRIESFVSISSRYITSDTSCTQGTITRAKAETMFKLEQVAMDAMSSKEILKLSLNDHNAIDEERSTVWCLLFSTTGIESPEFDTPIGLINFTKRELELFKRGYV